MRHRRELLLAPACPQHVVGPIRKRSCRASRTSSRESTQPRGAAACAFERARHVGAARRHGTANRWSSAGSSCRWRNQPWPHATVSPARAPSCCSGRRAPARPPSPRASRSGWGGRSCRSSPLSSARTAPARSRTCSRAPSTGCWSCRGRAAIWAALRRRDHRPGGQHRRVGHRLRRVITADTSSSPRARPPRLAFEREYSGGAKGRATPDYFLAATDQTPPTLRR